MKENDLKTFVEIFPGLKPFHFDKDVGQIPYHFTKNHNYQSLIVTDSKEDFSGLSDLDNLKFKSLDKKKIFGKDLSMPYFIIKNAKKIDVLYQYHFGVGDFIKLALYSILYKIINPKGVLFMRFEADLSLLHKDYPFIFKSGLFKSILEKIMFKFYFNKIDILGTADFEEKKKFLSFNKLVNLIDINKVKIQLNGFNKKKIFQAIGSCKSFGEKENIIVTSGRLEDPVKGIDVLFKGLENVDLKNWKIYLVGSSHDSFQKKYNSFINANIHLKGKVISIGFLENKEDYYKILNKSKIYVLPSLMDGMPNVIPEAMALGNVIIGSSHHGMRVATEDGTIGRIHEIGDSEKLSEILKELMGNEPLLEELSIASYCKAHNEFEWGKIVQNVFKDYL